MNVETYVELMWRCVSEGIDYPAELRGKLSFDDAYLIQLGLLARYEQAGDKQVGWKVGLTAKAMQAQIGIPEPVFAFLLRTGHRPSGSIFDYGALTRPGFENELCLTLGERLCGPGITLEQAREAISHVAPAFEIIERRGGSNADLALTLADNGQQRFFVTGEASPLAEVDLATVSVEVTINGAVQERALGQEVLGTPVASIAWLANKLAQFGRHLERGDQIMSGSFTKQYNLSRNDVIASHFEPFGDVRAEFR